MERDLAGGTLGEMVVDMEEARKAETQREKVKVMEIGREREGKV